MKTITILCGLLLAAISDHAGASDVTTNRLIDEKSPYLLQHAHNPVDWYPWGPEALERARIEDKPIFLSIGYSTCHWCHVMERESFENEEIAALMNASYVCIKVDREERPDLDEIYMAALQAMGEQGGWPLNVFLTPDLVPFYGGTYFPPEDRFGRPGFGRVLQSLAAAWADRRDEIQGQAQQLSSMLARLEKTTPHEGALDRGPVDEALRQLRQMYDAENGGWGSAPKFPRADYGRLLLLAHARGARDGELEMALHTLDAMAAGGIHDQLGGGFSRYSTDARWLVPHFEKMLYDNAQLAAHYLEAFQITGRERYAEVVRDIFEYVIRDMTDEGGGFYSAEDADSEGVEGRFYVWSLDEVKAGLDPEEFEVVERRFGMRSGGNWEGHNILELAATPVEIAEALGVERSTVEARLASARAKLFELRSARTRPGLDDKILTAWNGMMIEALARGGVVLNEPRYLDAASRAADFVLEHLRDDRGLYRRWRDGEAKHLAYAEDYALLVSGLLELYESTLEFPTLETAIELHAEMLAEFADVDGALFNTRSDQPDLLIRTKTGYDGSTPTANSVAAANALRLFELTGEPDYADQCERILLAFWPTLQRSPLAMANLLSTVDAWFADRVELVLTGADRSRALAWVRAARAGYRPDLAVSWKAPSGQEPGMGREIPAWEGKDAGASITAYVCRAFACRQPTGDLEQMIEALDFVGPE